MIIQNIKTSRAYEKFLAVVGCGDRRKTERLIKFEEIRLVLIVMENAFKSAEKHECIKA